ncbi:C-Jun-amino-terminal kinase-interacting protein 2 isoform X1 [Crotalus tigris]|uniref:C-Jun-amino-terminal kinase-interacting protein 2 isoform X1 n=1 Tax=Crotalus tigris TaxID=88082 RepID=UPI00192F95D3|nr:C-Jun-amino-terminal kinase-interacting protein 2 isoform X1 [Crotalus tigris]
MADRAEMFSLSTFHSLSPPSCRPPQDISLEEFDDEDLSEITDDCGIGLNYDSDHNEKDCLGLGRGEQPHPICTFQEDFQEFEMIDDNEEEEEEEEEEEGLEEAPPSPSGLLIPSPSPEDTQKIRPTTLNLTVTSTQDSLNNNSGGCNMAPPLQRATWQETLLHSSSSSSSSSSISHAERPSPLHACLQDGPCRDVQSSKGPALSQAPCKPPLFDAEGNSQGLQRGLPGGEDYNMNVVSSDANPQPPSVLTSAASGKPPEARSSPPPLSSASQPHSCSPHRSPATESYCAQFQRDAVACQEKEERAGLAGDPAGHRSPVGGLRAPLSQDEPAKRPGDSTPRETHSLVSHASPVREVAAPLSSEGEGTLGGLPSASSDTTSPSSDPGIEADLTSRTSKAFHPCIQHSGDLSSPSSDSDVEGEIEAAFASSGSRLASNMISSISETELDLSSESSSGRSSHLTNSIEEASSPGSEADLEADLEAPGVMGLKGALLLGAKKEEEGTQLPADESLAPLKIEELYEDPSVPIDQAELPPSGCLELEINPDHSLESLRRSFYLPVGRQLLRDGAEEEGNSEYDSESDSESEPDLSEDSDSPWLLSNLVNKMISEGSYPIKCADECFPAAHSLSDTISPASDLEPELPSEALNDAQPCSQQSIELVDMETLRCSLQGAEEAKPLEAQAAVGKGPQAGNRGPYLLMSNSTNDVIAPVFPGRPYSGCCVNPVAPKTFPPREPPGKEEEEEKEKDCAIDGDLDSGILEDNDMIDDIRLEPKEGLDVSTAKTNRCFSLSYSPEEDGVPCLGSLKGSPFAEELSLPPPAMMLDDSLAYDSVKYTLVVDENTQLELVSLKRCTSVLSDDSELLRACDATDPEDAASDFGEGLVAPDGRSSSSEDSSPEADLHFSKKFLNVFVNSTSRSSSTESFGLFSCMVNGEEREQTHRAVFRFIPRHEDELELDVDDPILVELEEDDYWYRGYNMRTGERGIFPAFYAHEVVSQARDVAGLKRNPCWVEHFNVQFLGSVEVPYHQGNGILCAAMQKIATTRKLTVHLRPPATCDLEISLQGIKLILTVNEYSQDEELERCSHFFQMKNVSFCGCHPRNSCYFGFITKHPVLSRFACHVFVSQESMRPVAECVGRAFQEYYQEHLEFACPTEDIYLE